METRIFSRLSALFFFATLALIFLASTPALGKDYGTINVKGTLSVENETTLTAALAHGVGAVSTGTDSAALNGSTASGNYSFAAASSTASNTGAAALAGATASGLRSFAANSTSVAAGGDSVAFSGGNAVGSDSFAWPLAAVANNNQSAAIGFDSHANHSKAIVIGSGGATDLESSEANEVTLGSLGIEAFQVHSDEIFMNVNVGIGKVPAYALDVSGEIRNTTITTFSSGNFSALAPTVRVGDGSYGLSSSGGYMYLWSGGNGFKFKNGIDIDADTLYVDNTTNAVGIGITSPNGTLHVRTASPGSVTASSDADDLIVENSGHTGISILSPVANRGQIYFGSPDSPDEAFFRWVSDDEDLTISTTNAAHDLNLQSTGGKVGINDASPSFILDVNGTVRAIGAARLDSTLQFLSTGTAVNEFSTDDTLAGDSDVAIPTEQAVKAYVDAQVGGTLDFSGDSGTGSVGVGSQTLVFAGASNEIETSAGSQTITIGLPPSVAVTSNISIGHISPDVMLHLQSATDTAKIRIERNDTTIGTADSYGSLDWEGQDSGGSGVRGKIDLLGSGTAGGADMVFYTAPDSSASTETMRLTQAGNLNIGGAGAASELLVVGDNPGNINTGNILAIANASGNSHYFIGQAAATALTASWHYNATTANAFADLNTANLQNDLYVDADHLVLQSKSNDAWDSGVAYVVDNTVSHSGSFYVSIQNGTNQNPSTETAYWTDIGTIPSTNVGIGISNPAYKLDVYEHIADYAVNILNTNDDEAYRGIRIQCGVDTPGSNPSNVFVACYDGDAGLLGALFHNGSALVVGTLSDARLKEDITTSTMSGMDIIRKLRVADFKWKDRAGKHTGFIAQEIGALLPSAVSTHTYTTAATPADRDIDGYTTRTTIITINVPTTRTRILTLDDGSTKTLFISEHTTETQVVHEIQSSVLMAVPTELIPVLVQVAQKQQVQIKNMKREINLLWAAVGTILAALSALLVWARTGTKPPQIHETRIAALEAQLAARE